MTARTTSFLAKIVLVCASILWLTPTYSAELDAGRIIRHELGETLVPAQPQRVVVFDFGVLDTLDKLGIDVIALPKTTIPSYLAHYQDPRYVNVGSLKEPDFEKIHALAPDLIIISGRQADLYDEFQTIAPTIHVALDSSQYVASFRDNTRLLGSLFNMEEEAADALATIDLSIEELRARIVPSRTTALVVLVNDQSVSAYGPGSRFGFIHDEFGFLPVDKGLVASTHGQSISFEFILAKDPDYLFVIDRTAAISGQSSARHLIENQLVRFTKAYRDGNIVYLNPDSWYLSGGGLISMADMVREITEAVQ